MLGMLDMQRSYSEGVGQGFHSKPPMYTSNIRYQLAKQRVEDLFLKWLSMPSSQKIIANLIQDVKSGRQQQLISQPSAFFTNKMTMSAMSQSSILSSPSSKHVVRLTPTTPPRNETLFELKQARSQSEDMSASMTGSMTQSQFQTKRKDVIFNIKPKSLKVVVEPPRTNNPYIVQQLYEQIPQFYFPEGKSLDASLLSEQARIISEAYKLGKSDELEVDQSHNQLFLQLSQFVNITTLACGLPKQVDSQGTGKVSKPNFMKYWHLYLVNKDPKHRCFFILKKPQNDYIEFDDFKPYIKSCSIYSLCYKIALLETHAGLEFLQATPEFQDRYADTVVYRIFYMVNKRDNGKISWREFKQSDLFQVMDIVDKEDDINKIKQYFSYEHFYVVYCKFWELDNDHDFFISKEDFSRYSSHGLSRKVVDRIFDQVPRRFKSIQPGKMCYEDFIWFILSEEDKTTLQSIEYWFKIIDLDDNGIITGHEMEYFFDEQKQRMDYLNHEPVLFQDVVCQMVDLLHPDNDILFKLKHFKDNLSQCGVFFNFLTNLNKLVSYEQRDPFQIKHELTEHPGFSDWDRFAQQEYLRLAMEEENQDQGEVFEGDNPWDNESEEKGNDLNI